MSTSTIDRRIAEVYVRRYDRVDILDRDAQIIVEAMVSIVNGREPGAVLDRPVLGSRWRR